MDLQHEDSSQADTNTVARWILLLTLPSLDGEVNSLISSWNFLRLLLDFDLSVFETV